MSCHTDTGAYGRNVIYSKKEVGAAKRTSETKFEKIKQIHWKYRYVNGALGYN